MNSAFFGVYISPCDDQILLLLKSTMASTIFKKKACYVSRDCIFSFRPLGSWATSPLVGCMVIFWLSYFVILICFEFYRPLCCSILDFFWPYFSMCNPQLPFSSIVLQGLVMECCRSPVFSLYSIGFGVNFSF